ncbi:hypothetical protein BBG19_0978 [Francisella sp. MA067296]|nr:hypothetical protein BBG19_0978 [Francisella sp. MA067296]
MILKVSKNSGDKLYSNIASTYKGRNYQAIKYNNCVILLDKRYLQQLKP